MYIYSLKFDVVVWLDYADFIWRRLLGFDLLLFCFDLA